MTAMAGFAFAGGAAEPRVMCGQLFDAQRARDTTASWWWCADVAAA
jgi:hypothetical protein